VGDRGRLVGELLPGAAAAGAVMIVGGGGRDPVEPRAEVLGVRQARIGAKRAQERLLQDVLRL
jgi:hypothetical protein